MDVCGHRIDLFVPQVHRCQCLAARDHGSSRPLVVGRPAVLAVILSIFSDRSLLMGEIWNSEDDGQEKTLSLLCHVHTPFHYVLFAERPQCFCPAASPPLFSFSLLPQIFRHQSRNQVRQMGEAFTESPTFSWINSSFLASNNSFGTPWGLPCALRQRFHSSLQNFAVSLSRKPVNLIWRSLISG